MKRRTFMQWLAALPFFSGIKSKARQLPKDIPLNGTVWSNSWPICHTGIVLFLDVKEGSGVYILLTAPYETESPGTAMMIYHHSDSNIQNGMYSGIYTKEALLKKLSKWKRRPELELRLFNRDAGECVLR